MITPPQYDPILHIYNLNKTITGKQLFENTSFDVYPEDCIGLLGSQLWAAPITIKLATGMPPDEEECLHRGAVVFKKYIEQKAPGRLKVDIYPSNQLGKEREQFEGVKLGTIEMCWIAEGPMAGPVGLSTA
jgi:ATPase subunit of ABC transporter with duplicated ATPase domains